MCFFINYLFHCLFLKPGNKKLRYKKRITKCKQLVSHLSILSDIISPENGFALYFEIYLRQIIDGTIDKNLLMRLKTRLDTSNYWQDRFKAFNLSIDDLLNIADANAVMPPKSTWFEPKLADGMISLPLD